MLYKTFTIETRLQTNQLPLAYLKWDMYKQNRIIRRIFNIIQNKSMNEQKLSNYIRFVFQLDQSTTTTLIRIAKGRLNAIKRLKMQEYNVLLNKINVIMNQINVLKKIMNHLKFQLTDTKILPKYRRLKNKLWQKKQRYNRMLQYKKQMELQKRKGIYHICWGTKKLFKAQFHLKENGFRSHEGWLNAFRRKRDSQINFIGFKDEPYGNQNCQLTYDAKSDSFSVLIKKDLQYQNYEKERYFKIDHLHFCYLKDQLLKAMSRKNKSLTFRILRRQHKWYLQVMFTWIQNESNFITKPDYGVIGLDFNDGFISMSETDYYGNLIQLKYFPLFHHGKGNKAKTNLQQVIAQIVHIAKAKGKPIAIEHLNFQTKKAQTIHAYQKNEKTYNKMIHLLDYARYLTYIDCACFRNQLTHMLVNPAYTSKIAKAKFNERMKLNAHQGASYVIARRAQGYQDHLIKS